MSSTGEAPQVIHEQALEDVSASSRAKSAEREREQSGSCAVEPPAITAERLAVGHGSAGVCCKGLIPQQEFAKDKGFIPTPGWRGF